MKQLMRYRIISGRTTEVRDVLMEVGGTRRPRGHKTGKSSAKQLERNEAEAVRVLARELNCNCEGGWLFLTLKYTDERLPLAVEEGERLVKNFIRRLARIYKKLTGKKLVYFWANGERSSKTGKPCRLHHHLVLPPMDWETIAEHWPADQFSYRRLDATGDYTGIARYMIKNAGYGNGKRAWKNSTGIKKPVYTKPIPVNRAGGVRVPPEVRIVEREVRENEESGFSASYTRWVAPMQTNAQRHGRRRRNE